MTRDYTTWEEDLFGSEDSVFFDESEQEAGIVQPEGPQRWRATYRGEFVGNFPSKNLAQAAALKAHGGM